MNIVRLEFVHPGIAEFKVTYGGKTAKIKLEGLETTGNPEEDYVAWRPFYQKCLEEVFDAILASDTQWTDRSSK
ncbi:MAG: hypothetical protein A2Y50_07315 [Pseudomonadales bacterium RIFCSPLOWO2_12_59_9]|nr:MAG: hypothetical protein A2Y50_07315 [Pseudomonadales bacterium RIFCSPLOWO2_12_59_9]